MIRWNCSLYQCVLCKWIKTRLEEHLMLRSADWTLLWIPFVWKNDKLFNKVEVYPSIFRSCTYLQSSLCLYLYIIIMFFGTSTVPRFKHNVCEILSSVSILFCVIKHLVCHFVQLVRFYTKWVILNITPVRTNPNRNKKRLPLG